MANNKKSQGQKKSIFIDYFFQSTMETPLPRFLTITFCFSFYFNSLATSIGIFTKSLNHEIITHEFGHVFNFNYNHDSFGLMSFVYWSLLPGVPLPFVEYRHMSEEFRQEILKNKWRNFKDFIEKTKEEDKIPTALIVKKIKN